MDPEQFVASVDFRYLTDALDPDEALDLLRARLPASQVAAEVGIYDQSQLNRHFKRIVGVTPGQYARALA